VRRPPISIQHQMADRYIRRTKLYQYRCTSASAAIGGPEANNKHRLNLRPATESNDLWNMIVPARRLRGDQE
jgi:hypothetical protein